MSKSTKGNIHPINSHIKATTVLLLDDNGENVKVPFTSAILLAESKGLDLVQLGKGQVPACKILDYKKFLYHEKKKNKSKILLKSEMKEVQIRPSISVNDLDIKRNKIVSFLQKGSEVRLRLRMRGREKASASQHIAFLMEFAKSFEALARVESKTSTQTVNDSIVLLKPIKAK